MGGPKPLPHYNIFSHENFSSKKLMWLCCFRSFKNIHDHQWVFEQENVYFQKKQQKIPAFRAVDENDSVSSYCVCKHSRVFLKVKRSASVKISLLEKMGKSWIFVKRLKNVVLLIFWLGNSTCSVFLVIIDHLALNEQNNTSNKQQTLKKLSWS